MTMTDEDLAPASSTWQQVETDQHGDFEYTLRQFLLMHRLHAGGEWPDVLADVNRMIGNNEWDVDAKDTYRNWTVWYNGDRETTSEHSDSDS